MNAILSHATGSTDEPLRLAAWRDFRIAEAHSVFSALNRRRGVPFFDGNTLRLPRIRGLSSSVWLTETGVRIDARLARELGLADSLAPEDEARRRTLSDGVLLDRLQALAKGERRTPPTAA